MVLNRFWLCNYSSNICEEEWQSNLRSLWNGEWVNSLESPLIIQIFEKKFIDIDFSTHSIEILLSLAISALQAFVQDNFTGPTLNTNIAFTELSWHSVVDEVGISFIQNYLKSDDEEVNANISHPELLAIAKLIFLHLEDISDKIEERVDRIICFQWILRYYGMHQLVLEENTDTLFDSILKTTDILTTLLQAEGGIDDESKAICHLEITSWFLHYKRINRAKEKLQLAQKVLNINLSIEGKMGVRTKYQIKAIPQLMLKVDSDNPSDFLPDVPPIESPTTQTKLPTLLQLDDDILLERIKFINEDDNLVTRTKSVVQAFIFATFNYIQMSQPKDKLANEELMPYLTTLLYQEQGPWPLRIAVLLANITMESTNKRTVERSLKQCEELLKLVTVPDLTKNSERLSFVYASYMRPHWMIRSQLADLMVSLGLIKTALDIYLQIGRWEAVIMCYSTLDLKHKAAEILQKELKKKETVELLCLLGDTLDDKTWYEKAWTLSGEKSGRAQRHLGCYYFAKKQYENAIPHLERSVQLNSLQENVWARLGYSALELKRWELAAKAYRHYTNIEPNGFECWNNLAKAYLNLGDKKRAHKILTEALRCNYNNWKVWENFLFVSVDTDNFEDVLNAYYRLGELKSKYLDKDVLTITINAIHKKTPDALGRSTDRLTKKALNLLAQLCVQYPNEGIIFELNAKLLESDPLKKAQKLQKAYRAYTQSHSSWEQSPETTLRIVNVCIDLCNASSRAYDAMDDKSRNATLSQLSSTRLTTLGCMKAVKISEWNDQYYEQLNVLENSLEEIISKLSNNL